jgi:hypothetical protein
LEKGAYRLSYCGCEVFVVQREDNKWALYDETDPARLVYRRYFNWTAATEAARAYLTDTAVREAYMKAGVSLT